MVHVLPALIIKIRIPIFPAVTTNRIRLNIINNPLLSAPLAILTSSIISSVCSIFLHAFPD